MTNNNHVEDGEGAEVIDKRDVAGNDLSKMSHDDDGEDSGKIVDTNLLKAKPTRKKIVIKREAINFIVEQLELPAKQVETKLVEHDGDVTKTLIDLMGFA